MSGDHDPWRLTEKQSKAFMDLVVQQSVLLDGKTQVVRDRPARWWRLYGWARYLLQRTRWRLFGEPAVKVVRFKSADLKIGGRER